MSRLFDTIDGLSSETVLAASIAALVGLMVWDLLVNRRPREE